MKKEWIRLAGASVFAVSTAAFASPESFAGNVFDHTVTTLKKTNLTYDVCMGSDFSNCTSFNTYAGCVDALFSANGGHHLSTFDSQKWLMAFDTRYMCLSME